MIYVTHDQIEAMTLADRIVLLRDGQIEQVGHAARPLSSAPPTRFVAGFLGSPQMNFIPGAIAGERRRSGRSSSATAPASRLPRARDGRARADAPVVLGLRPQHIDARRAAAPGPGSAPRTSTVELVQPTGSRASSHFPLGGADGGGELDAHDVHAAGRADRCRPRHEPRRADRSRNRTGAVKTIERGSGMTSAAIARHPAVRHRGAGRAAGPAAGRPADRGARGRQPALHPLRRPRGAARHLLHRARQELGHLHARDQQPQGSSRATTRSGQLRRGRCDGCQSSSRYRADDPRRGRRRARLSRPRARPDTDFLTNRTGFVVLHPLEGVAGRAGHRRACRRPHGRDPLPGPDRPGPAHDGPARADPRVRARRLRSPAAWRATPSRWRTSATGPTPPTRPMCGRWRCPGPTRLPAGDAARAGVRSRWRRAAGASLQRPPRPRSRCRWRRRPAPCRRSASASTRRTLRRRSTRAGCCRQAGPHHVVCALRCAAAATAAAALEQAVAVGTRARRRALARGGASARSRAIEEEFAPLGRMAAELGSPFPTVLRLARRRI